MPTPCPHSRQVSNHGGVSGHRGMQGEVAMVIGLDWDPSGASEIETGRKDEPGAAGKTGQDGRSLALAPDMSSI